MSLFDVSAVNAPRYSTFDTPYDVLTSLKLGRMVPIDVIEIIPGDKVTMHTEQLVRLMPMSSAMMERLKIRTYYFYVPKRITWPNWTKFITGGEDGQDSSVHPFCDVTGIDVGTTPDYLSIKCVTPSGAPNPAGKVRVDATVFSGINLIWNEYVRDQNVSDEKDFLLSDGDNTIMLAATGVFGEPYAKAWSYDYFTGLLPEPQRGPQVAIPLGGLAPITFTGNPSTGAKTKVSPSFGTFPIGTSALGFSAIATIADKGTLWDDDGRALDIDNSEVLAVDLSQATATTINDLRHAIVLQQYYELNMRGGARYPEWQWNNWHVKSSDKTLQRPQYLGGGIADVVISEVLQTSKTDVSSPQGNIAGHGVSLGRGFSFTQEFEEHGWLYTFMCVLPEPKYFQGLHKQFTRFDRINDYYVPMFANVGEQVVRSGEIFSTGTADDEIPFGYKPAWNELRFINSKVTGLMQTDFLNWHMARFFTSLPVLDEQFMMAEDVPLRPFAVQDDTHKVILHVVFMMKMRRALPVFGNPGIDSI